MKSRQLVTPAVTGRDLDEAAIVEHLSGALRFQTVSHSDVTDFPADEFRAFREYLAASYPLVHATLSREILGGNSLLYTWQGSDSARPPIILMAHQDVVPVNDPDEWTHPPFAGTVEGGYVWGRGAIDNKNHVIAILEAVERLLRDGVVPQSTVYLAFGHDEEVGGHAGASVIARTLHDRGVRAALVLDEGGLVLRGVMPTTGNRPVALVGIAEKGAANVAVTARYDGPGHSSVPPPRTPVGRLGSALHHLEAHQCPARITEPLDRMLEYLGPELPFAARVVVANRPLTDPLLRWGLTRKPATAALVRTTTAATMFQGSAKENLVPPSARAVINFRILTGESVESTLAHVRRTIADEEVEIDHYRSRDPSPMSPTDTAGFMLVQKTVSEVIPEAVVVPWLMSGGTDSRHYRIVAESVYGFSPGVMTMDDVGGAHGMNERISVENLMRSVRFYTRLLENASMPERTVAAQRTDIVSPGSG